MKNPYFRFLSLSFILLCSLFIEVSAQQQNIVQPKNLSNEINQTILKEINAVRANPQIFIPYLESYRKIFKGNTAYYPDGKMVTTIEGTAVIDDAIAYLRILSKLPPYTMSNGLLSAANSQLTDLMENSSLGHYDKDGSDLPTRLRKFGAYGTLTAENITYYAPLARDIVMTMIIDDGVKSRGHRKNLFSPGFKQIGAAFSQSKKGENLCVVIFADSFREGGAIPSDKRLKTF